MNPPVEAPTSMHTRPATLTWKCVEGVHELLAATAHERRARPQLDRGRRGRHQRARLVDALPIDEHVTRQDLPGGLFATLDQPLVDEQFVDPNFRCGAS